MSEPKAFASDGSQTHGGMKPRLRYTEVFPDFEHMAQGTPLVIDGLRVSFQGHHFGSIWIGFKGKIAFLKAGDPAIGMLRRETDH